MTKYSVGRGEGSREGDGEKNMASERHKTKFVQSGMVESHDLKASIRRPCFANPAQPVRAGRGGKKRVSGKTKTATVTELLLYIYIFFFISFGLDSTYKYFHCNERISTTSHCTWRSRAASCSAPMPPALCKDLCAVKSAIEQCYYFLSFPVSVFPHM